MCRWPTGANVGRPGARRRGRTRAALPKLHPRRRVDPEVESHHSCCDHGPSRLSMSARLSARATNRALGRDVWLYPEVRRGWRPPAGRRPTARRTRRRAAEGAARLFGLDRRGPLSARVTTCPSPRAASGLPDAAPPTRSGVPGHAVDRAAVAPTRQAGSLATWTMDPRRRAGRIAACASSPRSPRRARRPVPPPPWRLAAVAASASSRWAAPSGRWRLPGGSRCWSWAAVAPLAWLLPTPRGRPPTSGRRPQLVSPAAAPGGGARPGDGDGGGGPATDGAATAPTTRAARAPPATASGAGGGRSGLGQQGEAVDATRHRRGGPGEAADYVGPLGLRPRRPAS